MSGFFGFDRELLFGTQKESELFGVLLGCGGRQVKRSIWPTGGVSVWVCGGRVGYPL